MKSGMGTMIAINIKFQFRSCTLLAAGMVWFYCITMLQQRTLSSDFHNLFLILKMVTDSCGSASFGWLLAKWVQITYTGTPAVSQWWLRSLVLLPPESRLKLYFSFDNHIDHYFCPWHGEPSGGHLTNYTICKLYINRIHYFKLT